MPTLEQAAPVQGQHKGIIPSTEEARIRLDLAKQLETTIRERMNCKTWRFTASKLAVVFVMPLDLLRRMAESGKHPTRSYFTADFGLILASELAKERESPTCVKYLIAIVSTTNHVPSSSNAVD